MQSLEIAASDGFELKARLFEPRGAPKARVLIHPATATPQGYYRAFSEYLADRGFEVLTYDYRGIGLSRTGDLVGFEADMSTWANLDALAAQRIAKQLSPGVPLLLIGHSFGAQIAVGLEEHSEADGALFVGGQGGYYGTFPWPDRAKMWLLWNVGVPVVSETFGFIPSWTGMGEDLPKGAARQWARWCLHPDYYLSEHPEFAPRLADYRGNVLALSFTDDEFASEANSRWLVDRFERARLHHRMIAPSELGLRNIGHFGFFRRRDADKLWPIATRYLDAVVDGTWSPKRTASIPADIMADLQYGQT